MKKRMIRCAALLAALVLIIGLAPAQGVRAEEATQAPARETPAKKMSASELQAQGILTVGAKGEEVTRLQQRLKDLGYLSGKVDGQYGGGTKRAVIAFQRRNGLDTDGVAGQNTLDKIYAEDAVAAPEHSEDVDVLAGNIPLLANKDHPVDEFFRPANLVTLKDELNSKLVKIKYKKTQAVKEAVDALRTMLEAAREDKITKWQISAAYRSWDDQVSILNAKVKSYQKHNKGWSSSKARRAALKSVAEPGASEHHLGLAFDINVPGASSFASTKQSKWLNEHCWEFGFIIRYQKDKEEITGFVAEPWHIRYVGVDHALYMKDHNLCLEEYLQGIEDGSIRVPAAQVQEDVPLADEEPGAEAEEEEDAA